MNSKQKVFERAVIGAFLLLGLVTVGFVLLITGYLVGWIIHTR